MESRKYRNFGKQPGHEKKIFVDQKNFLGVSYIVATTI